MKHSCGPQCEHSRDLIEKADKAFSTQERVSAETLWAELAEFILPTHNSQFRGSQSKATKRDQRVFDSTAIIACRDLSSAIHSTITNPAMKWSKFRFTVDDLNNDQEATLWLDQVTDILHSHLSESNFDLQAGQSYLSLCGLGTSAMFQEEVMEPGQPVFNFVNWHLSEIAYAENKFGIVDTIYRKFNMTCKQLVEKFPDTVPNRIIEKCVTDPLCEEEVYQCISAREKEDVYVNEVGMAAATDRPFSSYYILKDEGHILDEDGYYEFPVFAFRWAKLPEEVYGFGPGHVARPDVRTICKVREIKLQALAKAANPPIISKQSNIVTGDFRPGKVTVVRSMDDIKEFMTQTKFDVMDLEHKILADSIKSAFYIDKLMLPPRTETGEMTAYEISQRLEQMQTVLGPVLNRLNMEFLQPLIMRCLKILVRNKLVPDMPEAVIQKLIQAGKDPSNIDLEINFVNSLSRSQQLGELRNVQSFVQEVFGMAQANPEVLDKLNLDSVVEYAGRIRSIPEHILRTDKEVEGIRQQRQQAMQAQQQLAAGQQLGDIVKNVGSAIDKGGAPQ